MLQQYSTKEKGDGKPLLLLHGYLSNKESFNYQFEYLSKSRRVVAIDLPGFGFTPEPPFAYALDDYVQFVIDVIDRMCGGKTDIIAHSFGGRIAIKLAAKYPEKVDKVLLVGAAGLKPRRGIKYYIKVGTYKALKKISPKTAKRKIARFASSDYMALSPVMRESFKKIVNENLDGLLYEIKAPTLIVFGSNDDQTPLYMAKKLHKNIAESGLVVMQGCGHFCFVESPRAFSIIASEFFGAG